MHDDDAEDEDGFDRPLKRVIEDGRTAHTVTNWIMSALTAGGAFALAAAVRLPLNFNVNDPEFNPLVLGVVLLGAVSAGFAFVAVKEQLRSNKFGHSSLEMDGYAVAPGQTLAGFVRTSSELRPTGNYELHFQCLETVVSTSNGKTRRQDHVRWESLSVLDAQSVSSTEGLPVRFEIPERCRKLWDVTRFNSIRWVLEVRAPLPGLDYYAIFAVPVVREAEDEDED